MYLQVLTGLKFFEALSGEGNDAVDLTLQSVRSEILEELNIDPQLLSQPQAPFNAQLSLSTTIPTVAEVTDTSDANSHLAIITTHTQPQPTMKCKADDIIIISESEPEDSGQPRAATHKPPCKIMWHMTATTSVDVPEVAASQMTPKQWAAATETYNNHLKEKNHANGSEMNDFKSHSGSETFWRRHCHAIELIEAKSGPGKKIRKAHTCSTPFSLIVLHNLLIGHVHWPAKPGVQDTGRYMHFLCRPVMQNPYRPMPQTENNISAHPVQADAPDRK
ncbi:hypothetical protein F4604DRAFT_1685815 [Suillus subluteus]|nr:hypothetical protein F4604DRAFT_1685815 [Suillus subluteus]